MLNIMKLKIENVLDIEQFKAVNHFMAVNLIHVNELYTEEEYDLAAKQSKEELKDLRTHLNNLLSQDDIEGVKDLLSVINDRKLDSNNCQYPILHNTIHWCKSAKIEIQIDKHINNEFREKPQVEGALKILLQNKVSLNQLHKKQQHQVDKTINALSGYSSNTPNTRKAVRLNLDTVLQNRTKCNKDNYVANIKNLNNKTFKRFNNDFERYSNLEIKDTVSSQTKQMIKDNREMLNIFRNVYINKPSIVINSFHCQALRCSLVKDNEQMFDTYINLSSRMFNRRLSVALNDIRLHKDYDKKFELPKQLQQTIKSVNVTQNKQAQPTQTTKPVVSVKRKAKGLLKLKPTFK